MDLALLDQQIELVLRRALRQEQQELREGVQLEQQEPREVEVVQLVPQSSKQHALACGELHSQPRQIQSVLPMHRDSYLRGCPRSILDIRPSR